MEGIRNSRFYLSIKLLKYLLWNAWFGGSVRISQDRYLATKGVFFTSSENLKYTGLTPYSPFKIMNREAVESWRQDNDRR